MVEPECPISVPSFNALSFYYMPRREVSSERPSIVHRLFKKETVVLALHVAKQKKKPKKKVLPRNKRYRKLRNVNCNVVRTFSDHSSSKALCARKTKKKWSPRCTASSRSFKTHGQLARHTNGADKLKIVSNVFHLNCIATCNYFCRGNWKKETFVLKRPVTVS